MTVRQLAAAASLHVLYEADGERTVTSGYTGDLLSWVMSRAESGTCWVTIMTNINVAAVAQLTDAACVVFAEGTVPDPSVLDAAREHELNLYSSGQSAFELCCQIGRLLE